MRAVQRQPVSLLDSWAAPDSAAIRRDLQEELRHFGRKVVVLDDDPTGVQTVHDVSVYTDWTEETFRAGLESGDPLFFVLTNSRSFSADETARVHTEIADHLAAASLATGVSFVLISRSDSTLRGHFPLETETLRRELEARLPERYDGEILLPFFLEGGRFTVDDVHYVREGDTLVPAGETEFARDTTFAYTASDLKDWCEEKTGGAYPAGGVVSVSMDELRRRDVDGICRKLLAVTGFNKVVVNAVCYDDVAVFVTAYLRAVAQGKVFLFRGSAAVVKILGNVSDQPLLCRADLMAPQQKNGGIIIVGSHVRKTTLQLEALQRGCPEIEYICFDVNTVFDSAALTAERRRILKRADELLAKGVTVAVYTSRMVLRSADDQKEKNLALSVRISDAITSLVAELSVSPAFVLAKGGITSSDVGVKALRVHCARVRGQIAPGVPVWETGEESTFPHTPYVIFPGNVGTEETLCQVVKTLLGK